MASHMSRSEEQKQATRDKVQENWAKKSPEELKAISDKFSALYHARPESQKQALIQNRVEQNVSSNEQRKSPTHALLYSAARGLRRLWRIFSIIDSV